MTIVDSHGAGAPPARAADLFDGKTLNGWAVCNGKATYVVEKGEIVGRVKDLSIAGNIYDLLKDVSAVSQEAHWVFNSFHAPYILLPEMNVAGKN